jgi:hypothetical protein
MGMTKTWMAFYSCNYGRNGWNLSSDACDESWQDEVPTPRAWSYCPYCGKRRSPQYSRIAGEEK